MAPTERLRVRLTVGAALLTGLASAAAVPATAQLPGQERLETIPGTQIELRFAFVPAQGDVQALWMGVHEVTHEQFAPFRVRRLDTAEGGVEGLPFDVDAVTRPSPPYEDPAAGMGQGRHPAAGMTRLAALHYARWLSFKTGRLYRLPTEAEWEHACRAGAAEPVTPGPDQLTEEVWHEGNSSGRFHIVGGKAANAWGLHDMRGNVAEWVLDGRDARGRGVVRGGAFDDPPERAACDARLPESPAWKRRDPQIPKSRWWNTDAPHVGFRLVSPAAEATAEEIRAYWAEVIGG